MTFIKKGYGRIYVSTAREGIDPVAFVEDAIRELDEFEFGYLPRSEQLVLKWEPSTEVELIFTGKFEADIDMLTEHCWRAGVHIWCITQHDEHWTGLSEPQEKTP